MREKLLPFLNSWVLSFLLSASSLGCLVSGFSLPVDLGRLTWVWAIAALLCSLAFLWRRGGGLLLCLAALVLGWLWRLGTPAEQFLALAGRISQVYDSAYHWGYLASDPSVTSFDWPVFILGCAIAWAVSWTLSRRHFAGFAVVTAALPLMLCLVVTDTVPQTKYLFGLLAGITLLLLPGSVRIHNPCQASRLTAMAAIPVLAALTLLFALIPIEGYVNHSQELRDAALQWVRTFPQALETTVSQVVRSGGEGADDTIDLAALGPRGRLPQGVMTVTAGQSGTLYLRGRDYDVYDGTGWTSTPNRTELFTLASNQSENITIRTRDVQELMYLPYYPGTVVVLSGGIAPNTYGVQEYTLGRSIVQFPEVVDTGEIPEGLAPYLALPEHTRLGAESYLSTRLTGAGTVSQRAALIAAFVRSSAEYDLGTGRMPEAETDFALWFLEDADTGYCIHFATAATVLLRAAGIPARYVTGYLAEAKAGQEVTVTVSDAHAWAEYYEPALDAWLILEATPADAETAVPQPTRETETSLPTEPETTVQTLPTAPPPTQTTAPETAQVSTPTQPAEPAVPDLTGLIGFAQWGLGLGLSLLALSTQRSLRLALRRRRFTRGSSKDRALARWQECERLSRLLAQTPTDELILLAQKAKFSQHDLTPEELAVFDAYLRTCRHQLRQKPWHLRLVHQYLFAAY